MGGGSFENSLFLQNHRKSNTLKFHYEKENVSLLLQNDP